ncbi:MAG: class I adenylate-forming enzyme family protein [Defluviicoccus sp.]|nr:class I adenylate-forming enzyme family protein [Defluviicoccus sp.]MDE0384479.1 class I adenylate-forming enzyme family protein [Defluviicoccus sp.]
MAPPTRFTADMIEDWRRAGYWTDTTTLDLLEAHAAARPDEISIVDARRRLTWREALAAVEGFARTLAEMGLGRDTPVVLQLPNSVEESLIRLALKRLGLLAAYVPVVWRGAELEAVVDLLKPGAMVVPGRFRDSDMVALARAVRARHGAVNVVVVDPGADAADCIPVSLDAAAESRTAVPGEDRRYGPHEVTKLVVTSGSTGTPKLVERPEQQELLWGKGVASRMGVTGDDVIGGFVPMSGGPGYHAWSGWLLTGARFVLTDGFAPAALLPAVERERVSAVMTAPAILARLADSPLLADYDTSSLRVIRTGSANLPPAVIEKAEERLGCPVVKAGGAMEACSFGQVGIDDPEEIRLGPSIGRVMDGGEIRVVDGAGEPLAAGEAGELWIRGPATASGYFRDPQATIEAWGTLGPEGWFRTGDVATIDRDGYVTLVGRIKETINRGGMNVFPLELESILAEHPKILEAAVVGIPDGTLGEVPCLCAIAGGGDGIMLGEVTDFLQARGLARYKFPVRVEQFDDFPRGQTMRVNRRRLAERVMARMGEDSA